MSPLLLLTVWVPATPARAKPDAFAAWLPREQGTTASVVLVGLSTGEGFAFSGGGLTPSLLDVQ